MSKLRKDAEANRGDILAAADAVFARHGVTAPLDLVCREADVGRATLYRHFPDRHALMVALLDRALEGTARFAADLGERDDGFFVLLRHQAEQVPLRAALIDYWRVIKPDAPEIVAARARSRAIFAPFIARAISAGLCRADVSPDDVSLLTAMIGAALRGRDPEERAALALRACELLLDGVRQPAARPGAP